MSSLKLSEVVKHYRGGGEVVKAVDGVDLLVQPGELVALYGPSGSGKSTLLLLSSGLMAPERGSIVFDGRQVGSMSERESCRYRMRDVGFVFQSFHLMPGACALDNATIKLIGDGFTLADARAAARPWLERLGLSERSEHLPHELSMGERQRVAIARALVNEPRLLLADEPTGSLDSRRSKDTLALLRDVCHERRIPGLLVTHDPEARHFADRVHTLRDGRLTEGLDAELMATLS